MMDPRVPTVLEIAANVFNAASIVLAARNSLHTWWTGIVGCALFALVFVEARLYADFTLQIFFIGACVAGWWTWARGEGGAERRVTHTTGQSFADIHARGGRRRPVTPGCCTGSRTRCRQSRIRSC